MIVSKRLGQFFLIIKVLTSSFLMWSILAIIYASILVVFGEGQPFKDENDQLQFTFSSYLSHLLGIISPYETNIRISDALVFSKFAPVIFSSLFVITPFAAIAILAESIIQPVFGLKVKIVCLDPSNELGRDSHPEQVWLTLERESRARDYRKVFDRKIDTVDESVLDDSDLSCQYLLLVAYYRQWVFFGAPRVLGSARMYCDPHHIEKEIGESVVNFEQVGNHFYLVDRLSVCPTLCQEAVQKSFLKGASIRRLREVILSKLYCSIIRNAGSSKVVALARKTEKEELLIRYSVLRPDILGTVKYTLGKNEYDFRVLLFDPDAIYQTWNSLLPFGHELLNATRPK